MRARLKNSVILHNPAHAWARPGVDYSAQWSPKMISPPRVVLLHPERSDTSVELPGRFVEILSEEVSRRVGGTASVPR